MYAEMLGAVRGAAFNREFYRNCPRNADLPEMLALELTGERLPWQALLLAKFGDVLINTGTRMKKLAQPRAVLSQEML